jgi:hypothetical protein
VNAPVVTDSQPSIGLLVGVPAAVVAFAACVTAIVLGIRAKRGFVASGKAKKGTYGYQDTYLLSLFLRVGGIGAAVVTVAAALWSFYPWSTEYHMWRTIHGSISQISNRFIASGSDGGGSTQRFVVIFNGDTGQYSCDDTRCALLKVGDDLTISCKRAWQYSGTPGYDCSFVDFIKGGAS